MTDQGDWLHICKYYFDSTVHKDLIQSRASVSNGNYKVFCADHRVPSGRDCDSSVIVKSYPSFFRYVLVIRSLFVFLLLVTAFRGRDFKVVFCHTWVVDGILGYFYHKIFGTPYVILVRNTDLNFYYSKFPHLRWFFRSIIKSAHLVAFVSHSNRRLFIEITGLTCVSDRSLVWPNGLGVFWSENLVSNLASEKVVGPTLKILFVGRYDSNKNLRGVFEAIQILRQSGVDARLTCVGGSLSEAAGRLFLSVSDIPCWFVNLGKLSKEELLLVYRRSSCLCVPSFRETFGLVYLEALSQRLPVVLSQNQGVDGFFREAVKPVDPLDPRDIADGILTAIEFSGDFPSLDEFNWVNIGKLVDSQVEESFETAYC